MVLTGAEIDQVAGLLCLREREPFDICATAATLAALADNPRFGVLATDLVRRQMIVPGAPAGVYGRTDRAALHGAGKGSALS